MHAALDRTAEKELLSDSDRDLVFRRGSHCPGLQDSRQQDHAWIFLQCPCDHDLHGAVHKSYHGNWHHAADRREADRKVQREKTQYSFTVWHHDVCHLGTPEQHHGRDDHSSDHFCPAQDDRR